MLMTWLAEWNCYLIVQIGMVILNTPVEDLSIAYIWA